MSAHTPGPWEAVGAIIRVANRANKYNVAKVFPVPLPSAKLSDRATLANVDLITTAPELLAALKHIYETRSYYREEGNASICDIDMVANMGKLIARAEGRQP